MHEFARAARYYLSPRSPLNFRSFFNIEFALYVFIVTGEGVAGLSIEKLPRQNRITEVTTRTTALQRHDTPHVS
jgi:hypothetical protein